MAKIIFTRIFLVLIVFLLLILFEPIIKYTQYHSHIILSGQIKYFREGNLSPDRWVLGYLVNKYFAFTKNLGKKKERLDSVKIYFQESKLNKLVKEAPTNHRNWKTGYLNDKNNEIQKIKFRLRGENARNYALRKKSFKIKTSKKKLKNNYREIYYINPFDVNILKNYIPFLFAKELNILSPFSRLVELHTNDEYQGVYLEMYSTDELFLRNNQLMPTSIYKHSIDLGYKSSTPQTTAFMNGNLFFNQSVNNFDPQDNRFLLNTLLSNLNQNNDNFKNFLDKEKWANYAVYRILSGDFHSNGFNNLKLNADNHIGKIQNVLWDPITDTKTFKYKTNSFLNYCTNIIDCNLTLDLNYRLKKIRILDEQINKKNTIDKIINILKKQEAKFTNSLSKDKNRLDTIQKNKEFLKEFFRPEDTIKKEFNKIYLYLENNKFLLEKLFKSKIDAKWNLQNNILSVYINNFKPITEFKIMSDQNIDYIFYDVNNNGVIDKNDLKIESIDKNTFKINLFSKITCLENRDFSKCADKEGFNFSKHSFLLDGKDKDIIINDLSVFDEFNNYSYNLVKSSPPKIFFSNNKNFLYEKKLEPLIISTDQFINDDIIFDREVIINPGVKFHLTKDKSIIFKDKLTMNGSVDNPIIFKAKDKDSYFGTVALLGKKLKGSKLNNVVFENGSGTDKLENITFISMLSIHNVNDIVLRNIKLKKNDKYDDLIHIIYSKNIELDNIEISESKSDAIDIDISDVKISNLKISNSKNDCLDLMMSKVEISYSNFVSCGDKGISVGEKSKILINNLEVSDSTVGIAAKDNSKVEAFNLKFNNNKTHIDSFNKNWQYGLKPSNVEISNSIFYKGNQKENLFNTKGLNYIKIKNSKYVGAIKKTQNVEIEN